MKTNKSYSFVSYFNLFYLFFYIIWDPLQGYFLHVDGARRTILLLSIIALFINIPSISQDKKLFKSPAFLCWTLLIVYSMINSVIKGFESEWGAISFFRSNYFDPYVFLIIAIIELNRDKYRCLFVMLGTMLVYMYIGNSHVSLNEYDRFEAEELGNMLPLTAAGCAFVVCVLFSEHKLKGGWAVYTAILVFVMYIIIMSGTRKAFGAVVIVFVGMVLTRSGKLNFKTLVIFIVAFIALEYILNNTMIGERIFEGMEMENVTVSFVANERLNNLLLKLFGDRSLQYFMAFELIPQHPITGIGLNNFMSTAQYEFRLHTEYMVQLCENGIIGFAILIVFYYFLFRGLNKKRKAGDVTAMYVFGLLMVLFLDFSGWTYNMYYVMIVYAVLISEIYSTPLVYDNSHTSSPRQLQ